MNAYEPGICTGHTEGEENLRKPPPFTLFGGANDSQMMNDGERWKKKKKKVQKENFERLKAIITEKGVHKDWTQREIALNSLQECFEMAKI